MDIRKSERIVEYLSRIARKYEQLNEELSKDETLQNPKKLKEISKQLAQIKPIYQQNSEIQKILSRIKDNAELIVSDDRDLRLMAEEENLELEEKLNQLLENTEQLLVVDQDKINRNVFLEIRAGAGGEEAALFAADLLRMYLRVAERKNWKSEIVSRTSSSLNGIKEVIIFIKGAEVYKYLQFESGVHRVQRVPQTEASGRIHTSTVTVAVLPEVEDVEIEINPKDLRIDTFAASGHGGQHVNKTESAVRITHFPSGIVVACQDEKSQHKNKEKAMSILKARLYEFERSRLENEVASARKKQVGSGERAEKIRTYNFPQNRVTDHRLEVKNYNLEFVLDGDLDELFNELLRADANQKIEELLGKING